MAFFNTKTHTHTHTHTHRKEANLARVLPVIDEIEIETIIGTFGLSSVQFSCSVMSNSL